MDTAVSDGGVEIRFAEAVRAVTPGQAAVFYENDVVLFGGFIDEVFSGSAAES